MSSSSHSRFSVTLERGSGYQFDVMFDGSDLPTITVDEPAPLGDGAGPNAARLLAASVANCLAASFLFCLQRARVPVDDLRVRASGSYRRNDEGRLRLGPIKVRIESDLENGDLGRFERCRQLFEDFCVVTQSLREGIQVEVEVAEPLMVDLASAEI